MDLNVSLVLPKTNLEIAGIMVHVVFENSRKIIKNSPIQQIYKKQDIFKVLLPDIYLPTVQFALMA